MSKRVFVSALVALAMIFWESTALAQRGPGGRGGGGMSRPMGGASRPSAPHRPAGGGGGMSRPMPSRPSRPAMPNRPPGGGVSRPGGGMPNRPPGGMARPGGGMTRPGGGGVRPGGGMTRPVTLPGGSPGGGMTRPVTRPGTPGGGNRPGGGVTRPTPLPGNRPGGGVTRPTPLPGNRPGGGVTRPTPLPGNRPGGGVTRPTPLPGNRPGGSNRPGGGGIIPPGGGLPGGGTTRPVPLPGNRPGGGGNWGGGGNRPPWNNRPGGGGNWGGGGNRPPWNNRPGGGGNWNGGGWGGGNSIINNNTNNNINNNIVVNRPGGNWGGGNWGGGNWGGGNWGGGGWGGGGWGGGGWGGGTTVNNFYGPGWSGANWGNWYRGPNTGFWSGFGLGAFTGWGANALFNPRFAYSSFGYFPTAWAAPVYGSWGLGSIADSWMYAGYANPFATGTSQTVIIQQPPIVVAGADAPAAPQPVVAYDYSQPISTANPPEPDATESAQKVFEAARDSFKAGDFARALSLADQALVQLPNDSTIHEFRALCLFAAQRYDDAAAAIYAVLSAGPGWDWATLINLYPNIDAYTNQLRALEAYVKEKPDSASGQFLLGYFYLVQDHKAAAAARFTTVARLEPKDQLSTQLAQALVPDEEQQKVRQAMRAETPPAAQPTPAGAGQPDASGSTPAPPRPPADLVGTWSANPEPQVAISLAVAEDGNFTWAVTQADRTQTIQGRASYKDDVLVLGQENGPPLTGKVELDPAGGTFTFKPPSSSGNVTGLHFTKDKT